MNITILIDGDNIGSEKLQGLHLLGEQDEIIIFNNSASSYGAGTMNKLLNECKCSIIQKRLTVTYKNSVDFAIAIELGRLKEVTGRIYAICSGDNDLCHIADIYNISYGKNNILLVGSDVKSIITQSIPFCVDNKERLKKIYKFLYKNHCSAALNKLGQIFIETPEEVAEQKPIKKDTFFTLEKLRKVAI